MRVELKEWLRVKWRYNNHNKYQKYFDEWFSRLTESQLDGFQHQMFNDVNNILRKQINS